MSAGRAQLAQRAGYRVSVFVAMKRDPPDMSRDVTARNHPNSHSTTPIRPVQLHLLVILSHEAPDLTVDVLARIARLPKASCYVHLGNMRRGGLLIARRVTRRAVDGRRLNFVDHSLTRIGEKLAQGYVRFYREIGPKLIGRLGLPNAPLK